MHAMLRKFLDQLAVRIVPVVTSLVAGRLEAMRSLLAAEDQAELEEAARKYDSMGMPHVATALRSRMAELGTDDPCRAGVRLIENLGAQTGLPDPGAAGLSRMTQAEPMASRRLRQPRKPSATPPTDDLDL